MKWSLVFVVVLLHGIQDVASNQSGNRGEVSVEEKLINYLRSLLSEDKKENLQNKQIQSLKKSSLELDNTEREMTDEEKNIIISEIVFDGDKKHRLFDDSKYKNKEWQNNDKHIKPRVIILGSNSTSKRSFALEQSDLLWPQAEQPIPYFIQTPAAFDASGMTPLINQAIAEFQSRTCLQFTEINSAPSSSAFMGFKDTSGSGSCFATLGYFAGGETTVNLGSQCNQIETVLHEIMHGIGMYHNQQRSTAYGRLETRFGDIQQNQRGNFESVLTDNSIVTFDLQSVLQYGATDFAKIANTVIMTPDDLNLAFLMSFRHLHLDFYDVAEINHQYGCSAACTSLTCQNKGFAWKTATGPCQCECPNEYITGSQCETLANINNCGSITTFTTTKETKTLSIIGYQTGQKCAYLYKAVEGYRIKATVTMLNLPKEADDTCIHRLEARYNLLGQQGVSYCGNPNSPIEITTRVNLEHNYLMLVLDAQTSVADTSAFGITVQVENIKSGCFSNPCKHGGTCVDNPATETHTCTCAPGFSGDADCMTVLDATVTCDVETSTFGICPFDTVLTSGSKLQWIHVANSGDQYDTSNGLIYLRAWTFRSLSSNPAFIATLISTPNFAALSRTLTFDYYIEVNEAGFYLEVSYTSSTQSTPQDLQTFSQNTQQWTTASITIAKLEGLKLYIKARPIFGRILLDNIQIIANEQIETTTTTTPTTTTTTPTTTTTSPTTTTTSPTTTTTSPTTTTTSPTTTTTSPTTTTTSPTTTTTSPTTTTTSPTTTTTSPTTTTTSPTTTTTSPTTTTTSPTTTTTSPKTTTTSPTTTATSPTTTTTSPKTTTTSPTTTTTSPTTTTTSPTTTTTSPTTTTTSPTTTTTSPKTTTTYPTTTTTSPTTTTTSPTTTTTSPTTTTTSPTTTTTSPTTTTYASTTTTTVVQNLLLECDAEGGLASCPFAQASNDDFDWTRHTGLTRSGGTGPNGAQQGMYYFYIEASVPRTVDDAAILETNVDLPESDFCLSFWAHMRGSRGQMGKLQILYSGTNQPEQVIWSKEGNQGRQWFFTFVQIPATPGLKIYIKGIRGTGFRSDVAIDDIVLQQGRCPDICNAEADISECVLANTGNDDWSRVYDPYNAKEGSHYFFIRAPQQSGEEKNAVLETNATLSDSDLCLSFWYSMDGDDESELNVITSGTGLTEAAVWSMVGRKGRYWHRQVIDITGAQNAMIKIEGELENGNGYIALDDIIISRTQCDPRTIYCSFESRNFFMCPVFNEQDDDQADWRVRYRYTPSAGTGPLSTDTRSGWYFAYLEATGLSTGDTADLVISHGFPDGAACLCFKYHMYGEHMGSLLVLNGGNTVFVEDQSQDDRAEWQNAIIDVTLTRASKLLLRGIRGTGYKSDIAIDELLLSPGACSSP